MRKQVKETKTIITPKENSIYFDVNTITYKRKLKPIEKQWAKYQKNSKKKQKKHNTGLRILILLFILTLLVFAYIELAKSFPETFNIIPIN